MPIDPSVPPRIGDHPRGREGRGSSDAYIGATFIDGDRKVAVGDSGGKIQVVDLASGTPFAKGNIGLFKVAEMAWNEATGDLAVGTDNHGIVILKPLEPPDTTGPVISVTAPSEGLATKETSLTTTGLITDQSQVTGATLNGVALALDGAGAFSATVPLVEGSNTLTYGAADILGNTNSVTRTVTRVVDRTAPVISGLTVTPAVGPPGTTFVVACSVVDADTGVATASATVRNAGGSAVGAVALVKQSGSTYQGSLGSTGYAVGNYTLDVTAVDSSPQANSRTVTGAGSLSVAGPQTLNVGRIGAGAGTVTSAPAGVSCGTTCSATFTYGTGVTLTASAASGSSFVGWTGGGCAGTGTCQVTMTQARSVTAGFEVLSLVAISATDLTASEAGPDPGRFTVTRSGSTTAALAVGYTVGGTATPGSDYLALPGTVTIPTGAASATVTVTPIDDTSVESAETVIVTISANAAYTVGSPSSATVTITDNDAVTTNTLTVQLLGTGSGSVASNPAGISCGSTCSSGFSSGVSVTLTATPNTGSRFAGWAGGGCAGTGTCTVTMSTGKTVTATFLPTAAYRFYAITPCRVVDTRNAAGPLGGPALAATATRALALGGACGVPADAAAVSLNVTVADATTAGTLTIYPGTGPAPNTNTISFRPGKNRANNVLIGLIGGAISVVDYQTTGTVNLIVDVNGYYR